MTSSQSNEAQGAGSFLDRLESSGTAVKPLALGEMIDYSNVPGAIVKFLRSDKMPAGRGPNARPWLKHVFSVPSGEVFALGGCLALDTRLRSVKAGDVLGIGYKGKAQLEGDREQHDWSVTLVAVGGEKLKGLIVECGPVYRAILEAVEQARTKRAGERAASDGAPPHDDSDYQGAWG